MMSQQHRLVACHGKNTRGEKVGRQEIEKIDKEKRKKKKEQTYKRIDV